jgi:hypothetical protein
MAKTADELLAGIKKRIVIPASQALLTDPEILSYADMVTSSYLVPVIRSTAQEYFVTKTTTPTVANQAEYAIPYRAIGRTLRDLKIADTGGSVRDMPLIALEDAHLYSFGGTVPTGHYFQGDRIVLLPTPQTADLTLHIFWEMPPGKLALVDNCARVTGITATTVTVSAAPSTITTGTVVDFIAGQSGNSTLAFDKTVSNVAATTYTFATGDIPATLAIGDYVAPQGCTPYVQLPNEAMSLLETATDQRILNTIGDFEGAGRLEEDRKREDKDLKILLEPRNQGENAVFINRRGLLRGSRSLNFRRWP